MRSLKFMCFLLGRAVIGMTGLSAALRLQSNDICTWLHNSEVMNEMGQIDRVMRSNLKLRHLQLLVALDELRHVGRAAEFLSISQPAVSKTLAEIERMYGLSLFDRSTRGTVPTASGSGLLRFPRSVLPNH